MSTQIITNEAGQPAFAVLPYAEYERLAARAESADEVREFDEAVAADEEAFPADVVRRLIDGDAPIKVYREYRNMSQSDLAARSGLTAAYVSQLEAGVRRGSADVLRRLASALNVDMEDLMQE
jgi:ribosome-binding protein aMBF1 (putative translation factor)